MKRRLELEVDFLQPLLDIEAISVLASIREFVDAQIQDGFDSRKIRKRLRLLYRMIAQFAKKIMMCQRCIVQNSLG